MKASSAKASIMERLNSALAPNSTYASRQQTVNARINAHETGIVPANESMKRRNKLSLFKEKVLASEASFQTVTKESDVAAAISKYLRNHNLPAQLISGTDKRLDRLGWPKSGGPERITGASDGSDLVSLSHAEAAVAESGTLVLTSGPQNPTRNNFLSETHIVVVNEAQLKRSQEGVWKILRRKFGTANLPRTVNLITGPSRSADIEQTLILGAHGPLRLHVIVIRAK